MWNEKDTHRGALQLLGLGVSFAMAMSLWRFDMIPGVDYDRNGEQSYPIFRFTPPSEAEMQALKGVGKVPQAIEPATPSRNVLSLADAERAEQEEAEQQIRAGFGL
jgi:hypothetical protein